MARARNGGACLLYFCFVLLGLYIASYQQMVELMAKEFGMNLTWMGVMVAIHFVGSVITPPLMGRLSDRHDARTAIALSISLIVAGLALLALGRARFAMTVGIGIVGCGYAAIEGLLSSTLAALYPHDVERVISRSQMWFCVGAVAGPMLSARMLSCGVNWRVNEGILLLLFVGAGIGLLRVPYGAGTAAKKAGILRPSRAPLLLGLCAAMALYVGVEQGLAFFMGSYYAESDQAMLSQWALSAYWMGMCIGRLTAGWMRKNHRAATLMGLCGAMMLLPLTLWIGRVPASILLFGALGLAIAATWPFLTATAARNYEAEGGIATGYMMTAGALGGAVFPLVMGRMAEHAGVGGSLWMLLGLLAMVTGLLSLSGRLRIHREKKSI